MFTGVAGSGRVALRRRGAFHAEGRGPKGREPYEYAYLPMDRDGLRRKGFGINRGIRGLFAQDGLFADVQQCEQEGSASGDGGMCKSQVYLLSPGLPCL